jgi:hypothetical protein
MDYVSRTAAENALKAMGETSKQALIKVICASPHASEDGESPSILLRRRSAMRILADLTVTMDEWSGLKEFLHDDDPEISISAARMALDIAGSEDKKTALITLMGKIPFVNWYSQTEIESCLVKHYGFAYEQIVDQIAQRIMQPEKAQALDRVLQILLNVQRRAGEANEK